MELDQLKYKMQQDRVETEPKVLPPVSQHTIEKITYQKSSSLLDLIDQSLQKNMQYRSVIALLCIGIVLYFYDSPFWGYYFIFGTGVEAGLIYMVYKLRKNIQQSYESDLPLCERFKNIQRLISAYLKFRNLLGIALYLLLALTLSLKNVATFNVQSILDTAVLFRFTALGIIFYFLHSYMFNQYTKPHWDMLVDLRYHIAELEESQTTEIKTLRS
ncbi:hypothetical protein ACR78Z_01330 [Sphingobacterium thalpophilum]|uniref:hypothetical protein n=1 Tax=Sphingobacterium thalpophilum TaxID=259 RepID=UPI003DA2C912